MSAAAKAAPDTNERTESTTMESCTTNTTPCPGHWSDRHQVQIFCQSLHPSERAEARRPRATGAVTLTSTRALEGEIR